MTQPVPDEEQGSDVVVAALVTGLAGAASLTAATAVLALALAVPPAVAAGLAAILWPNGTGWRKVGVPGRIQAGYLVNAARRIKADLAEGVTVRDALTKEAIYGQAHRRAQTQRAVAMTRVRQAARKYGRLLGWRTTLDARTSRACRVADGKAFDAVTGPHPGTLHGGSCRCEPTAPHKGAERVEKAWVKAGLGHHAEGAA